MVQIMFDKAKIRLKRKYRIHKRNKNNCLVPLKITNNKLNSSRLRFNAVLEEIRQDLEKFRLDEKAFEFASEDFSGYSILSYNGDRMGKVLGYQNKIYRGIYPKSAESFKKLWGSGLLQVLSKHKMIPETTLTHFSTEDYPIIIHHESVCISPSCSWSYDMIKDAAILICIIKKAAEMVGFTLHDGHLNNVTFDKGCPVFTDIGSFVENKGQYTSCNKEIVFTACYRLLAYHLGNSILNRLQLYDESNNTIWIQPIEYDDLTREYVCLLKQYRRYHRLHSSFKCKSIIRKMFCEKEVLPEYIDLLFPDHPEKNKAIDSNIEADIQTIKSMVKDLLISSCGDIGGNQGYIADELSAYLDCRACALEYDQDSARQTYTRLKKQKRPVDTYMFNYCFSAGDKALQPIVSDLFIAYDITNNCSIRQYYHKDSLLSSLCKLSRKYALAVYYPNRKIHDRYEEIDGSTKEKTDDFIRTFSEFFKVIEFKECGASADSEDYRLLILGEKK